MISGISSPGGYFPQAIATKARQATPPPAEAKTTETRTEADPAQLRAPEGDEQTLTREFNLFDLANRQFSQLLPQVESATVPVE